MLTTNGLMYVGNLDEDAEETPEHKVGNIVQPWPVAKKTKVQREAALWLCKAALPFWVCKAALPLCTLVGALIFFVGAQSV